MKTLFAITLAVLTFVSCTSQQPSKDVEKKNKLILYYSQTGATKTVAEEIKNQLEADIEAIEVETAYDGDFNQTIERCQKEMASGETPALKPIKANIADYDTIFIGYPIWFGTYAMPIAALVKAEQFEGKTIVPFCTFGSGGLQSSTNDLKTALPKANIVEGYGVRGIRLDAVPDEVNRFLIEWGHKEGEIEALPAFMEEKPVTDTEKEIFNQACSDYQFPLGTPVTVATRETSSSTDYLFTATSKGQQGEDQTSHIYVTVSKNEPNAKPVFTQVVR